MQTISFLGRSSYNGHCIARASESFARCIAWWGASVSTRICLVPILGIVILIRVLLPEPVFALDPSKELTQYVLSSWSLQNGLAQKTVMGVEQTTDGFLWLATEEGLVRFDGRTFLTFDEKNAPNLGDRFVRSLAAGPDGSLWIGTRSGLVRYRDGKFDSFRNTPETRIDIYDLCAARDGSVWFSSDRGLRHLQGNVLRNYTTSDGLPSNSIGALAEGADGTLWVATGKGLVSFRNGHFATYSLWDGIPGPPAEALAIGNNGTIWVGTRDGQVGRWRMGKITTWWNGRVTKGVRVNCLREDRNGNLWIAFQDTGLARMRNRSFELFSERRGLPGSSPDWILEDRESNLWVGWEDTGLSMLRDGRFTNIGKPEGLSSNSVTSVMQAIDGSLWVGTRGEGLDHLQGKNVRVFSRKDGLPDQTTLGLLQQDDGSIWVGSGSGSVSVLNDNHVSTIRLEGPLTPELPALAEDHAGNIWLGFDMPDGLFRFRDRHLEPLFLEGRVKGLSVAPDGSLWIASYLQGLVQFKNGIFRTYAAQDGLSSTFLTSVYADAQGTVWSGTALAGLNRWKNGRITHYSTDQGLADNNVGAVIEDDVGYLWLAGQRGISRIPLKDFDDYAAGRLAKLRSDSYGYADGLRSVECTSSAQPAVIKDKSGKLWFATTAGLAMIDPRNILVNNVLPVAQIENITFDGKQVPPLRNPIKLGPGNGRVEVSFAIPSFVAPDRMQVQYRLIGVDHNWIDAGVRRSATYTNLAPGSYRFEVLASNNNGRGSDKAVAKEFRILPHYYQTSWFRSISVLALLLAAWLLYVSRVQHFVRKARGLEEIVAQRTAELRQALNEAESAKLLLRDQAMRDSLTGFWNRRVIMEMLDSEIMRCQKEHAPLCVLMADLDHFKNVNDTFGHPAGDTVLRAVSDHLRQGLRRFEAIGRYGGEEFLVLLPRCSPATAAERAETLRQSIQASAVPIDQRNITVTCSFGVAEYISGSGAQQLVADADSALYCAKSNGRNCVSFK